MFTVGKKNKLFKNIPTNITNITMYLETEKTLLNKNYRGYHNDKNTTYVSNICQTDQIIFHETLNQYNKIVWSVSFPLKSSKMNYVISFQNKKAAKIYLNQIINTYI